MTEFEAKQVTKIENNSMIGTCHAMGITWKISRNDDDDNDDGMRTGFQGVKGYHSRQ
jgi:hypothetical protein